MKATLVSVIFAVSGFFAFLAAAGAQQGDLGGSVFQDGTGELGAQITDNNQAGDQSPSGGGAGGNPEKAEWNRLHCAGWKVWAEGLTARLADTAESQTVDDLGVVTDWYAVICFVNGDPMYSWDAFPVEVIDRGLIARRTRDQLLAQVRAMVEVPVPEIVMSPPVEGGQLVGLWAWFWVEPDSFESQSVTAADGDRLSVTLTAVPGGLRFFPGDDEVTGRDGTVVCEGPGLAWERGLDDAATDCKHFWDWPSKHDPSGQFTTKAEADYEFSWTASGSLAAFLPETSGTLGATTMVSPDTPVTVIEIQAVLD